MKQSVDGDALGRLPCVTNQHGLDSPTYHASDAA